MSALLYASVGSNSRVEEIRRNELHQAPLEKQHLHGQVPYERACGYARRTQARTVCPRSINRFTRCDPTKPLAPVTTTTSAAPNACEDATAAADEDDEDDEDDVRCVVMVASRSTADEGILVYSG